MEMTKYIFLIINHIITGGKVHISFGICLELITPSFKKSTPMILWGTTVPDSVLEALLLVPKSG